MHAMNPVAEASVNDYELDLLERLLVGTFDNYEQVYWEEERGVAPALRHRRAIDRAASPSWARPARSVGAPPT